jgi:hypothetical protein
MSRWLFAVAVVALSFDSGLVAQTPEQDVLKAEQARVDARRKGDSVAHAKIVSDDFAQVSQDGQLYDKKYAVSLAASPGFDMRDSKAQVFGDVAIVTGIQGGTPPNGQNARFTHVWRKQNGQWINVFVQNTTIPPAPPANSNTPQTPAAKVAPTTWPDVKTQDERDLLAVQRGLNQAFAKKDVASYSKFTADSFVRVDNEGQSIPRAEFLKVVADTSGPPREESNNSDMRIRIYGPISVVTYVDKTAASLPKGTRMTRVFVKENAAWKQLVTQGTTIR